MSHRDKRRRLLDSRGGLIGDGATLSGRPLTCETHPARPQNCDPLVGRYCLVSRHLDGGAHF